MATSFRIAPTKGDIPQVVDGEQTRAQPIVHVVIVVGDIVRQRGDLGLRAGMGVKLQVVPRRISLDGSGARICLTRTIVLCHPFQGLPGEVQAVEVVVALLQGGQDAHGLRVVVETAVGLHRLVERILAGMAEGRVPEVVRQRQRLGEVLVHPENTADRAGNLRHLQAVGEARAVVIPLVIDEDLRLVLEPAEGRAVDNAVAVALEGRPRAAFRFWVETPAAPLGKRGVRRSRAGHGRRSHVAGAHAHISPAGPRMAWSRFVGSRSGGGTA